MPNEHERKTETLAGFDVVFKDTENIIRKTALKKHGAIIHSINDFIDAFLKGYSSIKHNNENTNYYIWSLKITAYNQNICKNQYYNVFGPQLTEFILPVNNNFFKSCDHTFLKLYVTFDENDKEGLIINFRIDH